MSITVTYIDNKLVVLDDSTDDIIGTIAQVADDHMYYTFQPASNTVLSMRMLLDLSKAVKAINSKR